MDSQTLDILSLGVIGLSLAVLITMLVRGALSERALNLGPTRELTQGNGLYVAGTAATLMYITLHLVLGNSSNPIIMTVLQLMPFVLVGLLINRAVHTERGLILIGLLPHNPKRDIGWALIATVVGFGLASAAGLIINVISQLLGSEPEAIAHEALKQLKENPTLPAIIFIFVFAAVLTPIIEECVFRGVLQTSLMRLSGGKRWPALLLTSAIFSVVHWWAIEPNWQSLIPLFVIGLVFGYVYERTGSLLTPILTHAGFNAINIVLLLLMPD